MFKKNRIRRAALLAAILPVLATGCESIFGSGEIERERDELREARARWESSGIDSYEMVVTRVCYCGELRHVRVRVQGGVVVSRVDAETGQPIGAGPPTFDNIDTVEEQFQYIDEALDDDPHQARADYDGELGFATSAYFDPDENIADEEGGFVVEDFILLPVPQ